MTGLIAEYVRPGGERGGTIAIVAVRPDGEPLVWDNGPRTLVEWLEAECIPRHYCEVRVAPACECRRP